MARFAQHTYTDIEGHSVEVVVHEDDTTESNWVELDTVKLAMALRAHDEDAYEIWLQIGDALLDRTVMQRMSA